MVRTIIFTIGAISVVLGLWCLFLSLQTLKIEKMRGKNE